MPPEIEAKIKVSSFRAVLKALREGGAVFLRTAVETDLFFDTSDGDLRHCDCGLRIRKTRVIKKGRGADEADGRPLLTYKGPKDRKSRLKIRMEIQTRVDDSLMMEGILRELGYSPTITVRKRRSSYQLGRCRVELDELPGIGRFVEIEGPSASAVTRTVRLLKLKGRPIAKGYVSMVSELLSGSIAES